MQLSGSIRLAVKSNLDAGQSKNLHHRTIAFDCPDDGKIYPRLKQARRTCRGWLCSQKSLKRNPAQGECMANRPNPSPAGSPQSAVTPWVSGGAPRAGQRIAVLAIHKLDCEINCLRLPRLTWIKVQLVHMSECSAEVGFCCVISRDGLILSGQLLHVLDLQRVDMPPQPTQPASYATAADSPLTHLARAEHLYVLQASYI